MKNKIIKPSTVTFLTLCIAVVAGSNNLKIFRNIDGLIVEVPSKVEVPNGANLTLICQIEDIKSKGFVNGYIAWFIAPKIHSELKLRASKNSSNLVFSNVNTNDEGLYVCASLKFKIFKTLLLLVKQSKSAKPNNLNFSRLIKRESPGNDQPFDDRELTEVANKLEKIREELYRKFETENRKADYGPYNNDISLNKRGHPNTNSFPIKAVFIGLGTLVVFVLIFFIIYYCHLIKLNSSTNRRINRQRNENNPEVTVPRTNGCGHTSCSGSNLLNPSGACRFRNNSSPITPIIFDPMDIERPPAHSMENPITELDLPPTYSSSTHNSSRSLNDATNGFNKRNLHAANSDDLNLPPSYDEAIGYKNNRNRHSGYSHSGDNDHVHRTAGDHGSGGGGGN